MLASVPGLLLIAVVALLGREQPEPVEPPTPVELGPPLVIGVPPVMDETLYLKAHEPLRDHLQNATGREILFEVHESYDDLSAELLAGRIGADPAQHKFGLAVARVSDAGKAQEFCKPRTFLR